jgi:5-(carboxyamino)imidazole ribonucleotide mutase
MARQVAMFMGSKSDLPVMEPARRVFKELGVEASLTVASAHRSPEYVVRLVRTAEAEGVRVFIAAAGGAAHLAGVIAAHTTRPVIGVPVSGKLNGLDALLSTVQMPTGVPVATVAVDGAANAAYLAAAILGVADPIFDQRLKAFRQQRAKEIEALEV